MCRIRSNETGVTLIELLVVLVIVVAGLSIIGPSIGAGQDSTNIKAAAKDIGSALRFVRGHALAYQQPARMSFDLRQNSYQVDGRSKVFQLPNNIIVTLDLAQSQVDDADHGHFEFFPDGSASGGRIILELDVFKKQIDINWLTGNVKISDG